VTSGTPQPPSPGVTYPVSGEAPTRPGAMRPVLLTSLRDLQWRIRRFLLAAVATGFVLALALMMSGISNSFSVEVHDTIAALGAQTWLVRAGSPGPFTDPVPLPLRTVAEASRLPGVTAAAALVVSRAIETTPGTSASSEKNVNVLGVEPGRLGSPAVVRGHGLGGGDEIVADESLDVALGSTVALNGTTFRVVGLTSGITYFAGQPVVFMGVGAINRLDGLSPPVATAVLLEGVPTQTLPGFTALTDAQVRTDLGRPVAQASKTIELIEVLLWIVAAAIIAAIIYLSALERRADFAVMKAVGTPSWHLFVGLVVQAALMACAAAAIGFLVEAAVAPTSSMAVRLSGANYAAVPVLAVLVGIVASFLPARRAARVDPARAFGAG
jgi:putative ABC transport system permease protein